MNIHPGSARKFISNTVTGNSAIHNNVIAASIPAAKSRSCSKRLVACIAPMMLALVAMPLTAATEFENSIPIELARLFLGNPGTGGATIYQDIMDEFPPFTVPDAFEVMGSLDQMYLQRVVLRTDLDAEAAKTAITGTFTAAGWQVMDFNNFRPGQQGGFVSATQPECRCRCATTTTA